MDRRSFAWVRALATIAALGAAGAGLLDACGSSNDTGAVPDDASTDATSPIDSAIGVDVAPRDVGVADTGADTADAPADGPDAGPHFCVGSSAGAVKTNITCPPSGGSLCDSGGSCTYTGSASFTTCSLFQCNGTVNSGSGLCNPATTCDLHFNSSDYCAACGMNATCKLTDDISAGSQAYWCGPGSDCTIDITVSSGSRTIDCSQAKRCRVTGFVSGETQIACNQDCQVEITGGFTQTCCYAPPITCPNGRVVCPPVSDAGDGGDAGDAAFEACAP